MIALKGARQPTLTDGRLVVRPWRPDDAAAVFAACQDAEIARWTKLIPQPYQMHHATGFIAEAWRQWVEHRTAGFAIVAAGIDEVETAQDEAGADLRRAGAAYGGFLGAIGLDIDTDAEVGEFGYWVAPWARRRGVASGAVRLVAAWGLEKLELGRVQIQFLAGNEGSRRVAESCGFSFEGILRASLVQRGERVDTGMASLLATDTRPW